MPGKAPTEGVAAARARPPPRPPAPAGRPAAAARGGHPPARGGANPGPRRHVGAGAGRIARCGKVWGATVFRRATVAPGM